MTAAIADDGQVPLRDRVAEEVRVALTRRRLSGAELARRLGRSQTFVQKRLDGRQAFDVDDLEAVAAVLEVPVMTFFAGSDSMRSLPPNATPVVASGQVIDLDAWRAAAPVPHQIAGRGGEDGAVA